jgi:hypothetical protein
MAILPQISWSPFLNQGALVTVTPTTFKDYELWEAQEDVRQKEAISKFLQRERERQQTRFRLPLTAGFT